MKAILTIGYTDYVMSVAKARAAFDALSGCEAVQFSQVGEEYVYQAKHSIPSDRDCCRLELKLIEDSKYRPQPQPARPPKVKPPSPDIAEVVIDLTTERRRVQRRQLENPQLLLGEGNA